MNTLPGKTIRWTIDDGQVAGTTFDHVFNDDGSVTWRIVDGPHEGATATEKSYRAVKVNDKTWAISYLAASGHTLTVILNVDDRRLVGFASDSKTWSTVSGSFEVVEQQ